MFSMISFSIALNEPWYSGVAITTPAEPLTDSCIPTASSVTGSPGTARLHKFDERRVEDLQTIHAEIERICFGDGRFQPPKERQLLRPLPATLEEVASSAKRRRPDIRDPETGEAYGYEVLDETHFRLCATFRFLRDEERDPIWPPPSGRRCFPFDALNP